MSDWSDTSEAADSDTSISMPRFSRPWGEKKKAAAKRAKREYSSPWMRYYNLSAKQRRAEDKRIADKLAAVEAEFREVEEFELTYVPFEYRTRGSSLSPHTPSPKKAAPASDAVLPASPLPSTSKAGLPEPPREAQQPDDRRVKFRLVDGPVVSSSDDEDITYVSRGSRKRLVYTSDDDANARRPPTASERRVHDVSSEDDDVSGRVVRLSKVRETPGAMPCVGIREEDVDREGGGAAERASSSSLTRADIIRKRKERIARQRSLIEEISSGYRSSSDESSRKRSFHRTPAVTPRNHSGAVPGRRSHVRRALWSRDSRSTPSPTSSVEEPLRVCSSGDRLRPLSSSPRPAHRPAASGGHRRRLPEYGTPPRTGHRGGGSAPCETSGRPARLPCAGRSPWQRVPTGRSARAAGSSRSWTAARRWSSPSSPSCRK